MRAFSTAEKRTFALSERVRIRQTLARLTPQQWEAPSLCDDWTVRHVAGHVAENTRAGMASFLVAMAGTGFDHDEYNRRAAARWAARPTSEIVDALDTDQMMLVFRMSPAMLMVDNVVHHQDIRRPLGLGQDFPEDLLAATLTAVMTDGAFKADAKRFADTRITATDIEWEHGDGPDELRGPAEMLIMKIMGREVESRIA